MQLTALFRSRVAVMVTSLGPPCISAREPSLYKIFSGRASLAQESGEVGLSEEAAEVAGGGRAEDLHDGAMGSQGMPREPFAIVAFACGEACMFIPCQFRSGVRH